MVVSSLVLDNDDNPPVLLSPFHPRTWKFLVFCRNAFVHLYLSSNSSHFAVVAVKGN